MALPFPASVPVEGGRIISRQGPRPSRRTWHNGVDISSVDARGRSVASVPVYAIATGVVELVNACCYDCSYGNVVVLRHNGERSVYAHLERIDVAEGDHVDSGQQIGLVGNTTSLRSDMVPHLHLEIVEDWPLGPRDFDSRYDVLHELAAGGVVLEEGQLVDGTPRQYDEPLLADLGKGPEEFRVIVAPDEDVPGPSGLAPKRTGLVVSTIALVVAVGIFVATAWVIGGPRRRLGYHPPRGHETPLSCSPWRSVLAGGENDEVRTVCTHRSRIFRQARVWTGDDGVEAVIEDGEGRRLLTKHLQDRWSALRWAEDRLAAGTGV